MVGDGQLLVREGDCWLWEGLLIGGEGSGLVKGTIGRRRDEVEGLIAGGGGVWVQLKETLSWGRGSLVRKRGPLVYRRR